ncbi:MAG TPA: PRC-barrel domain-containing protein [Telluria sp.]
MKRMIAIAAAAMLGLSTAGALAQQTSPTPVAGSSTVGVTVVQMDQVLAGSSAKRDLIGKVVINDADDRIGKVEDVIISPDNQATYAIVGVGGFLGLGRNDVAVPMTQLQKKGDRLMLPGATKDALKGLPKFEYAKKK